MNVYRYNPVFKQWVLLGSPAQTELEISPTHLLDIGRTKYFGAATLPRQPFILDPPHSKRGEDDLLFQSQPPLGEAEVFLYSGEKKFTEWGVLEWKEWLELLQLRLLQLYHNPHLHFATFSFSTALLNTAGSEYLRVGDLAATSHPIAGEGILLTPELVEKLRKKESAFIIKKSDAGALYVPSAPLLEKEVWFLPETAIPNMEGISKEERADIAGTLHTLFEALQREFNEQDFTLKLHTLLNEKKEEATWWMQIYQPERGLASPYPTHPLPEAFARHLEFSLTRKLTL